MLERNFAPGFRVNLHRKDLAIALSTGRETGVPMPMTPEAYGKHIAEETEKWRKVVEFAGVSVD